MPFPLERDGSHTCGTPTAAPWHTEKRARPMPEVLPLACGCLRLPALADSLLSLFISRAQEQQQQQQQRQRR